MEIARPSTPCPHIVGPGPSKLEPKNIKVNIRFLTLSANSENMGRRVIYSRWEREDDVRKSNNIEVLLVLGIKKKTLR